MKRMIIISLLVSCSVFGMEQNGYNSNEPIVQHFELTKEQKSIEEVRMQLLDLANHVKQMSDQVVLLSERQMITPESVQDLERFTIKPGVKKIKTLLKRAQYKQSENSIKISINPIGALVAISCGAAFYYYFSQGTEK